jgi:outer membrane protein assembly factor BamB
MVASPLMAVLLLGAAAADPVPATPDWARPAPTPVVAPAGTTGPAAAGSPASGQRKATAPVIQDSLFSVVWRKPLVEPWLLEYKPTEPASPAIDPVTRMVVVATRDGVVQAFSVDGQPLWHHVGRGPYVAGPYVADDLVFAAGIDGKIFALDRASGEVRWTYQIREEIGTQALVVDDLVYFATLEGTVLALEARTGRFAWNFRREPTGKFTILGAGRPTVVDGVLYKGFADGSVVAFDAKTGSVKWDRKVGRGDYPDIDASVLVSKNRAYVASYGGPVMALDRADGGMVWESKVPFAYKASLDGDLLVVVSTTEVVGLDVKDGRRIWETPLEGTPYGDPVIVKGIVLVPNGKGLLVLDRRNGKKLRLFTRGSGAMASPAVLGKRVYVLSNQGELVAVDLR